MKVITDILQQQQTQDLYFSFKSDGLPDAEFAVREFSVKEKVFSLFEIEIDLASEEGGHDLKDMMDKPAVIAVFDRYKEKPRYFHGVVASASKSGGGHHRSFYQVTLKPALHRACYTSDSRIFQSQTVPEILEKLLRENGISDYRLDLANKGTPREFCVQYRESDFLFMKRLMAECGMHYYHEHREDGHKLVISDISLVTKLVDDGTIEYNAKRGGDTKGSHIRSFNWREQLVPSRVALKDYTFKGPAQPLLEMHSSAKAPGQVLDYEMYDYPGRHKTHEDGKQFAQYRLEGMRCETSLGSGEGFCFQMSAGKGFKLTEYDDEKLNQTYFIIEANHFGTQPGALEEDVDPNDDKGTQLLTQFRVTPIKTPWRPEQLTKPVVDGLQMAHVVGPKGEEIYCDEHGRIKVRFNWDRYAKNDDTDSCWIRVTQPWAGTRWGHIAIPRIGSEVMIAFLDSDPDQPIVLSRGFHDRDRAPYTLPAYKTRMTIQSKTHKGNGYNELRFEDEMNQEEIYIQGEKYLNAYIKDNETWLIGGSRHKRVDGSQSEEIGGSKDAKIKGEHTEEIDGSHSYKIEGSRVGLIKIGDYLKVTGNKVTHILRNCVLSIAENLRVDTKGKQHFETGTTHYINAGDSVVITAGSSISFNVGGNFIKIDGSGVQAEGSLIKVNCGGSPPKGSEVALQDPIEPTKYAGPYAERYKRSFEK